MRQDLKKQIVPEVFLYSLINKSIRKQDEIKFSYNDKFRAVVLDFSTGNNLIDKSVDGQAKIIYPYGYVRAFIPGVDDGIPTQYCRVFRPIDKNQINSKLEKGDLITVTFEDPNFAMGIWLGKVWTNFGEKFTILPSGYLMDQEDVFNDDFNSIEHIKRMQEKIYTPEGFLAGDYIELLWPVTHFRGKRGGVSRQINFDHGVRSRFGLRSDGNGGQQFHWGVDLTTNGLSGVQICAAYDGVITSIMDWNNGKWQDTYYNMRNPMLESDYFLCTTGDDSNKYNKIITIRHTNPKNNSVFLTSYTHVYSPFVKIGDNVKKGQIIAVSGPLDLSSRGAPHLHFMVYEIITNPVTGQTTYNRVDPFKNNTAILKPPINS